LSENVYSVRETVGSSQNSIEDAIAGARARARKTLRNLDWFEGTEIRGRLDDDGTVGHYQVALKLGFRMEQRVDRAVGSGNGAAAGLGAEGSTTRTHAGRRTSRCLDRMRTASPSWPR
jgi:dodecin